MKFRFKALCAAAVLVSTASGAVYAQRFTDVPTTFWGYEQINYVNDLGMMSGYPNGEFKPHDKISRAEAVTVLVKYLGVSVKPVVSVSFSDISPSDWYTPYIEAGKGLLPTRQAYNGDHPFLPNQPVNREDITYAIVTALGYASQTNVVDQSVLNMFSDAYTISKDVKPYVAFALTEKLVSGYENGRFEGQNPLSRAEFAAMMYKAAKHGKNLEVDDSMLRTQITGKNSVTYKDGVKFRRYAGNGARKTENNDDLLEASFVSPESITVDDKTGRVYIADSGKLRVVDKNKIRTFDFDPAYITPYIMEAYDGDLYFISDPFEDNQGKKYYSVIRMSDKAVENLYMTDAVFSKVYDMSVYDGNIYILQYNAGYDINYLCRLNIESGEFKVLRELDGGFMSLDVYNGVVYLANTEKSYIARLDLDRAETAQIEKYCGVEGEAYVIDGRDMRLFAPRRIECKGKYIYVLDHNLLRRVDISDTNWNVTMETLAGGFSAEVNPVMERELYLPNWNDAYRALFSPSSLMDFCFVSNNEILLTDPKKSTVWIIKI